MLRIGFLAAAAVLAACATQPSVSVESATARALAAEEKVDASYKSFPVAVPARDGSKYPARFYFRSREANGKLVVCGLYVIDAPIGIQQALANAFADERSYVKVAGKPVATLRFLPGYTPMTPDSSRNVGCVVTGVAWDPAFSEGPFLIGWPSAHRL